jgi:hypothetical protein
MTTSGSSNDNGNDNPLQDGPAAAERPRRPRRIVSYAILGGALLTVFGVLAAERQSRGGPRPGTTPPGPGAVVVVPPARAADPPEPIIEFPATPAAQRPRVELVFALDTTSSMTNLIEGAKRKIWSLASFVAQGQPTPDLRVGLVAYRDVGDAYVTKVFDLDGDLDRVYRRLRSFRAEGGGDTPEHVSRALDESVHKMSWSQAPEVVKVIYLVGDAPPHTDYADGYDYGRAARAAAAKGIQLHTIQCGTDPETAVVWRRIASLGKGQFLAIQQDGGMHEEHTRYDDELAALHDKLAATAIAYGLEGATAAEEAKEAEKAPVAIKAARAGFMARHGKAVGGRGDLVESIGSGAVKLDDVQKDLPPAMQAMDKKAQAEVIASKQKERDTLTRRIDELSRLRKTELDRNEAAAAKAGAPAGFDTAAKSALKKSVSDNPASGLSL